MDKLEEREFHRRLNALARQRLELQSANENSFASRLARHLIGQCGAVNYIDFNLGETKCSSNQAKSAYSWRAKLIRVFIIYFSLYKMPVELIFLNRFDMTWFKMQQQLSNCSGVDLEGNLVSNVPAAQLLLDGDPTKFTLRLSGPHQHQRQQVATLNYSMFKPGEFECAPHEHSSKPPLTSTSIAANQRRLGLYRNLVKLQGNVALNYNFTGEILNAYMLVYSGIIYIYMSVLTRKCQNLDYSLLRTMLGSKRDLSDSIELIRREANALIQSSEHYTRIYIESLVLASKNQADTCSARALSCSNELQARRVRHARSVRHIKGLALSGQLLQSNRTGASIERALTRFNFFAISMNLTLQCLANFLFHLILHLDLIRPPYDVHFELDILDIETYIEISIYMLLAPYHYAFYIAYALVSCLDQIDYARRVRGSLRECRSRIESGWTGRVSGLARSSAVDVIAPRMTASADSPLGLEQDHHGQAGNFVDLEQELLQVFMEYKIFFRQSKGVRKLLGLISNITLLLVAAAPLLAHIYYDYLLVEVRDVLAYSACIITLAADLLFLPICRLNSCCQEIHRELCKLTARAVETMVVVGDDADDLARAKVRLFDGMPCCQNYDTHIVSLMRKQLGDPHMAMNNFAITIFNLKLTHENLIRMHFWFGILMLPTIFFDSPTSHGRRHVLGII